MLFTDATHSSGGVVPPFLIEQESLLDQIVRPFLPVFIDETLVLRQRLDTARRFLTERDATAYVIPKTETLPCGFVYKLPSLARREGEIRSPIRIGLGDCGRGKRRREPRNTRMQRAVNEFGKSRHSERISGVYLDRRTFSCQIQLEPKNPLRPRAEYPLLRPFLSSPVGFANAVRIISTIRIAVTGSTPGTSL